jgi:hypothetical protein
LTAPVPDAAAAAAAVAVAAAAASLLLSQGRQEFSPTPEEMKTMIRNFYAIQMNFIIKFRDDTIDDSIELAQLLQNSSAISHQLDLCLKTLDGDHVRPMAQVKALIDSCHKPGTNCHNSI